MIEQEKIKNFFKTKNVFTPKNQNNDVKGQKIISDLFDLFIDEPHLMPKGWNIF